MNILDRFMVALGFQVDTDGMEKFEHKTAELRAAALRLGAVLTGAAVGVGVFVHEVAEGMNKVYEFSEVNKVAAKSIEALKLVGIDYGITTDSMQESLGGLNRKLGEASAGIGRGAAIFKKLGLSAKDSAGHTRTLTDMLGVLAEKMQGGSRAENIAIAQRLGMDPKTVLLLEQGKDKIAALREEAEKMIPFNDADFKTAHDVDIAFVKAQRSVGLLGKLIAVKLMPYVLQALNYFQQWFKELRSNQLDSVTSALDKCAGVVGELFQWLVRIVNTTRDVIGWLSQFKVVIWLAEAAVGALIAYKVGSFFMTLATAVGSAAKAFFTFDAAAGLPVVLIGAIIIAIGLLIDDLWNYYHGNESLIGQLQQKFPYAIHLAWTALIGLGGAFVALKWKAISSMVETIRIMGMYAWEWISTAAKAVASVATQIGAMASLAASWIASHASMAASTVATYATMAASAIAGWVATAAAAAGSVGAQLVSVGILAAGWIAAHVSMAIATIAAYWPVLLVIAALALVIAGVWLVWKNWDKITGWMRKAWKWVVDEIKEGINWIVDKLVWLSNQGAKLISKIPGGKKYLSMFGVDADHPVQSQPLFATSSHGGIIGKAGNSSSSSTNSTVVHAPATAHITVISPDANRAGENVKTVLDRRQRAVVRNGQSAVAY